MEHNTSFIIVMILMNGLQEDGKIVVIVGEEVKFDFLGREM
jgi:hypothetical protein